MCRHGGLRFSFRGSGLLSLVKFRKVWEHGESTESFRTGYQMIDRPLIGLMSAWSTASDHPDQDCTACGVHVGSPFTRLAGAIRGFRS